jgi:hypothetical protein
MEETQAKKGLKEAFREFLFHLNDFLDASALIEIKNVKVLYMQEPGQAINEYYARGLIEICGHAYPIEVTFDTELGTINVDSAVFHYHLKTDQMIQFLKEIRGEAYDD